MQLSAIFESVSYLFAQPWTGQSEGGFLNYLETKFVEGGEFMYPILACLVLGLAFTFERFWTLTRSSTNTKKFVVQIKDALK
ncbi:MAG: MotA/TolQ/ExbB proton channel family protein, partial [Ignavibacteriales bacterium]|nr:MotA/TolQ/ExbB proton channel family protein [Ignavibacteriales bacterium]